MGDVHIAQVNPGQCVSRLPPLPNEDTNNKYLSSISVRIKGEEFLTFCLAHTHCLTNTVDHMYRADARPDEDQRPQTLGKAYRSWLEIVMESIEKDYDLSSSMMGEKGCQEILHFTQPFP